MLFRSTSLSCFSPEKTSGGEVGVVAVCTAWPPAQSKPVSHTSPSSTGSWKAEPKYKGGLPFKVYAEVKPVSQGTAGTIYKCLGAKSPTKTINGG